MSVSELTRKLQANLAALSQYKKPWLNLGDLCFPKQLAFLQDGARFVTAVTSRRAGKTTACALDLLNTAIGNERAVCLYVTQSRASAFRIIWPILKKINSDNNLKGVPHETNLSISFPNASIIYCSGASDRTEVDKFLGLPLKLVYVDEAQSFGPYLMDLINRVFAPATLDYAGKIKVIGTPGVVPAGDYWDLQSNGEWKHHHWTYFDNPWIPITSKLTHQEGLDVELKRKGVSLEDPTIQREFFGRWVIDTDSLVFCYNQQINHFDSIPKARYTYILGIDVGFKDADALAVLGWNDRDLETYVVKELVIKQQGITELVEQIESLRSEFDITKIVMDMGGLGKKIAEEIIRRYKIPVLAAEKSRKMENIELMNDALRTGRLKAKRDSWFAQDCMKVKWDEDKSNPERRVVSPVYHSDICDAVLYAWRESYSFTSQKPAPDIRWGQPGWAEMEVKKMEEAAEEHFRKQEEGLDESFL